MTFVVALAGFFLVRPAFSSLAPPRFFPLAPDPHAHDSPNPHSQIPDAPGSTRAFWLTPAQNALAKARMTRSNKLAQTPFQLGTVKRVFTSPLPYLFGIAYMTLGESQNSNTWISLMLKAERTSTGAKRFGITQLNVIPIPGYVLQMLAMFAFAWASGRFGGRYIWIMIQLGTLVVGNIILSVSQPASRTLRVAFRRFDFLPPPPRLPLGLRTDTCSPLFLLSQAWPAAFEVRMLAYVRPLSLPPSHISFFFLSLATTTADATTLTFPFSSVRSVHPVVQSRRRSDPHRTRSLSLSFPFSSNSSSLPPR